MHKMAMTGTFRAAVKTHHGAKEIFLPISAPFLETKISLLMHHKTEKVGGEGGRKEVRREGGREGRKEGRKEKRKELLKVSRD